MTDRGLAYVTTQLQQLQLQQHSSNDRVEDLSKYKRLLESRQLQLQQKIDPLQQLYAQLPQVQQQQPQQPRLELQAQWMAQTEAPLEAQTEDVKQEQYMLRVLLVGDSDVCNGVLLSAAPNTATIC